MKRIVMLLGALFATHAQAEGLTLTFQAGAAEDSEMAGVGLRLAPLWSSRWGDFATTVEPEFQLNLHRERDSAPGPDRLWQAGGAAMLRAVHGEDGLRPYVEVGLGLNYLTRSALGGERFGSRFQFGEHLGLGLQARSGWFGGWRFSHYSNAGLASPNDGIDTHQLIFGKRF